MPALELLDVVPTVDFTGAVPRGTVVFPIAPPVLGFRAYQASFVTSNGTDLHRIGIAVSPAWAQGASSVSVTPPDLSQLPGFTPDMDLLAGLPVDWTTFLDDRNMPYSSPLADGKRITNSQLSDEIQPPAPLAVAAVRKAPARLPVGLGPSRLAAPTVGNSARPPRQFDRTPRSAR